MTKRRLRAFAAAALVAAAALTAGTGKASAANPGFKVVIDHVDNPRGLAFGPDGALYVAAAGRAGTFCLSPDNCAGQTSYVLRRANGDTARVAGGLPSVGGKDGSFTVGVDDVSVSPRGKVFFIETSAGPEAVPPGAPPRFDLLGYLLAKQPGQNIEKVAAVDKFEFTHDPDHQGVDSDPYSVFAISNREQVVADAAGNSLLLVRDGKVSKLAVFPNNKFGGQAVPTSITRGPDGAFYVGELGGEGTPVGGSRVWRVVPGERPKVFRTGFSAITDVAFGKDGSLYVLELTTDPSTFAPTGAIVRVKPDGSRSTIGKRVLHYPGGLAIGADGSIYVSNWSVLPANAPTGSPFGNARGQVIRLTP
jgi:sugar lactone lactonase YvrE